LCDSKANTDPVTWQLQVPGGGSSGIPILENPSPTPTSALIEFETRNHAKKAVVSITTYNKKIKARKKSLSEEGGTGGASVMSSLGGLGVIIEAEPESPREQQQAPLSSSSGVVSTVSVSPEQKRENEEEEDDEDDDQEDEDDEVESLVPVLVDSIGTSQPSSHSSTPDPQKSPSPSSSSPVAVANKKQLDESYIGLWVMPKALFMKRMSKTTKEKKDKRPARVKDHKSNSRTDLNWRTSEGDSKDASGSNRRSSLNSNSGNGHRSRRSSTTPDDGDTENRRSRNGSRSTDESGGRRSRAGSIGREGESGARRGSTGLGPSHNRNRSGGSPASLGGQKRGSVVMQRLASGPPTADARGFGRGRGKVDSAKPRKSVGS